MFQKEKRLCWQGNKRRIFPEEKTKVNDIVEEKRNVSTIEGMVTESDLEAEAGIESIRQAQKYCNECVVERNA